MKNFITSLLCVMLASPAAFAQQAPTPNAASQAADEIMKLEAASGLAQIAQIEAQLHWAEALGTGFFVVGLTAGVSGVIARKVTRSTYGFIEKLIPDNGDILPGTLEAPWLIRVGVKGADKTARMMKKTVPLLIGIPTLVATGTMLLFTVVEVANIIQLKKALKEAKADYEAVFGSIK